VNRVFPQETFLEKVQEYAQELASTVSPRSLRIIKRQVYEALSQPLGEAFDISVREMMACFRTEDFKEGVAHFLQKRPAAFTGK
jgi:enoyl-CoA hydratase/carnithine racemase